MPKPSPFTVSAPSGELSDCFTRECCASRIKRRRLERFTGVREPAAHDVFSLHQHRCVPAARLRHRPHASRRVDERHRCVGLADRLPSSGGIGCRRSAPSIWRPRPSGHHASAPGRGPRARHPKGTGGPDLILRVGVPRLGRQCRSGVGAWQFRRLPRMRKGPDSPGLRRVRSCWGTWTRTKNNGTRNRRVANYTIPQWPVTEARADMQL